MQSLTKFIVALSLVFAVATPVAAQERDPQMSRIVAQRLAAKLDVGRSANALTQDCLMYLTLDTERRAEADRKALDIADHLIAVADQNRDQRFGWGVDLTDDRRACAGPGSRPGLRPGTCNPPGTEYTYQTGLALTCLARTYIATREARILAAAERVARDSWRFGEADVPCAGCFSYWPSYSENDARRYIRNMNATMGMGLAWLFKATGNGEYGARAQQIAAAEEWELQNGNQGYLGRRDAGHIANPAWESKRIENHLPLVAKGLLDIGRITGRASAITASGTIIESWIGCDDTRCKKGDCKYWSGDLGRCNLAGTLAACWFVSVSDKAADHCARARRQLKSWTNSGLWSVNDK